MNGKWWVWVCSTVSSVNIYYVVLFLIYIYTDIVGCKEHIYYNINTPTYVICECENSNKQRKRKKKTHIVAAREGS